MKQKTLSRRLLCGLLAAGAASVTAPAVASHTDVPLLDQTGAPVSTGRPYSPKLTCGTTGCHFGMAQQHRLSGSLYEADWALAAKTQYNRNGSAVTYDLPYPQHGVSAGYHFQQGRNIAWDATKQEFYGLPEFTSSAGMYGKF